MKKAAYLLHDGFELTEALGSLDILSRSHQIAPFLLSDMDGLIVKSSCGVEVKADARIKDSRIEDFDFLILPGGKQGVEGLFDSHTAIAFIKEAKEKGKHVHAICAAPSILGRLGYLKGIRATCFPGFELGEANWEKDATVITDSGTVTARSMGYSLSFGHAIVKLEAGEEADRQIAKGELGLTI